MERSDYPRDSSVVDVFRQQVASTPHTVAVKDSSTELTYSQLDEKSDELAYWLQQRRYPAETLVGVFAPRSCETIVAFLGVLKAGLAYLPLDTTVPKTRTQIILSSIPGHKLVVTGSRVTKPAIQLPDIEFVSIADGLREFHQLAESSNAPRMMCTTPVATSLAYVMFTSGSTGRPKGVMIEHRGIVRLVKESNVVSHHEAAVSVAHISNIAFDASTWEIYTALLNGGTLVCVDPIAVLDSATLGEAFNRGRVTCAMLTPALLKRCLVEIPDMVCGLDVLFAAGDRLHEKDASMAQSLVRGQLFNAYGPTENTVLSTIHPVHADRGYVNGIPIGHAVSNSGTYVMDTELRLVPIGVMGELVVTGDGVARGYTDPERNRGRFVDVVIDGQTVKAYRTGDYVRYRPTDRQLEFFGRIDYQVKIRGHRIELPEVEHALLGHEAVSDAITLLREQQGQDPELISFVTVWKNDHPSELDKLESQLRERLRGKLPSYMVPATIRVLERMPINANGKVDRQALAKIAQAASPDRPVSARMPPRNDVEQALCEEFARVLGTEVGITDSFFDLGGHSLIAARLVSSINTRLGCKIYIYDVLQSPKPLALSEIIYSRSNKQISSTIPAYMERHPQSSSRLTLVLIHGFWGQASIFSKLVTLLHNDFDILLIHDPFFGELTCPKSIKDWAGFYLDDIEKQILPGQALVLAGYSFGGLIAFEMAALWRKRHSYNPVSLVLLDAGTYIRDCVAPHDMDSEKEIGYALRLFGEGQMQMILDHFHKIAPLMCSSVQSLGYDGTCLYLVTPEAADGGAVEWWTRRCPMVQTYFLDCAHHDVLEDAMIGRVSRLVNEHCHHILKSLGSPTS